MRQARWKIPDSQVGVYHCISRVVDRRFVLGDAEKEEFLRLLREYEQFCGLQVLSYCLMSNHFHVLVSVPSREITAGLDACEILRRLSGLSGAAVSAGEARQVLETLGQRGDVPGARTYLDRFRRRMGDISEFMKLLKQRFTQWFNRQHRRRGTLWEDRFKSVLVEGGGEGLLTVAAYIDLNPVRAGLVTDPSVYRWSGYGEAIAGVAVARKALQILYGLASRNSTVSLEGALAGYRLAVLGCGAAGREGADCARTDSAGTDSAGAGLRPGIPRDAVLAVLQARGEVIVTEYLTCRVRYFCDGAALGSREFVEGLFRDFRQRFGPKRSTGARRMRGLDAPLYTLRDLQLRIFG